MSVVLMARFSMSLKKAAPEAGTPDAAGSAFKRPTRKRVDREAYQDQLRSWEMIGVVRTRLPVAK